MIKPPLKALLLIWPVTFLAACQNHSPIDGVLTTGSVNEAPYGTSPTLAVTHDAIAHRIAKRVPRKEAFATLSFTARPIVSVSEQPFDNGIRQIIRYGGDTAVRGENTIRVDVVQSSKPVRQRHVLKISKTTARSISAELKQAFPSAIMRINSQVASNAYGVFGMAHGADGAGIACHYGWQKLEGDVHSGRLTGFFSNRGEKTLSLRVRWCAPGMSVSDFERLMTSLELSVPVEALKRRQTHAWRSAGGPIAASNAQPLPGYLVDRAGFEPVQFPNQAALPSEQSRAAGRQTAARASTSAKRKASAVPQRPRVPEPPLIASEQDKTQLIKPLLAKDFSAVPLPR